MMCICMASFCIVSACVPSRECTDRIRILRATLGCLLVLGYDFNEESLFEHVELNSG